MLALVLVLAFEGPELQVPWQCGVVKPCTQGHNGFSHTGDAIWNLPARVKSSGRSTVPAATKRWLRMPAEGANG